MTLWAFSIVSISAASWLLWCWLCWLRFNLFFLLFNPKNITSTASITEHRNPFTSTSPSCNVDIEYIIHSCIMRKVDSRADSIIHILLHSGLENDTARPWNVMCFYDPWEHIFNFLYSHVKRISKVVQKVFNRTCIDTEMIPGLLHLMSRTIIEELKDRFTTTCKVTHEKTHRPCRCNRQKRSISHTMFHYTVQFLSGHQVFINSRKNPFEELTVTTKLNSFTYRRSKSHIMHEL